MTRGVITRIDKPKFFTEAEKQEAEREAKEAMNAVEQSHGLIWDEGTLRFMRNRLVKFLVENCKYDLNHIWSRVPFEFSEEEVREVYRLMGYSVSGYFEVFDAAE